MGELELSIWHTSTWNTKWRCAAYIICIYYISTLLHVFYTDYGGPIPSGKVDQKSFVVVKI